MGYRLLGDKSRISRVFMSESRKYAAAIVKRERFFGFLRGANYYLVIQDLETIKRSCVMCDITGKRPAVLLSEEHPQGVVLESEKYKEWVIIDTNKSINIPIEK